jgi:hypothetical protein
VLPMSAAASPIAGRAIIATILLLGGLGLTAAYRVLSGAERQSYSAGALAAATYHVTAGKTYELSVPGGVAALKKSGADIATAQCEWSSAGSGTRVLPATASGSDTKAIDVVATFTAPDTGEIHVDCSGWGAMYIDNADNAAGDAAGWFLVLGVIALAVGVGLGVSALRLAGEEVSSSRRPTREDDEIERLVHAVHVRSQDSEVADTDRGDVDT